MAAQVPLVKLLAGQVAQHQRLRGQEFASACACLGLDTAALGSKLTLLLENSKASSVEAAVYLGRAVSDEGD